MALTQQAVFQSNRAGPAELGSFLNVPIQAPKMPGGITMARTATGWGQPTVTSPFRAMISLPFAGSTNPQFSTMANLEFSRQWFRPRMEHMAYWTMGAPIAAAQLAWGFGPAWRLGTSAFYRGVTAIAGPGIEGAGQGLIGGLSSFARAARIGNLGRAFGGLATGALASTAIYTALMAPLEILMAQLRYGYRRRTMAREISEFSRGMQGMMPTMTPAQGEEILDTLEELRWEGGRSWGNRLRFGEVGTAFTTAARSGAFIGARNFDEMRRRLKEYTKTSVQVMRLLRTTMESATQIVGEFTQMGESVENIRRNLPRILATGRAFGISPEQLGQIALQGAQQFGGMLGPTGGARAAVQLQALTRILGPAGGAVAAQIGGQLLMNPAIAMMVGAGGPAGFVGIGGAPTPEAIFRGQQVLAQNPLMAFAMLQRFLPRSPTQRYWAISGMVGRPLREEEWTQLQALDLQNVQQQIRVQQLYQQYMAEPRLGVAGTLLEPVREFGHGLYETIIARPGRYLGGAIGAEAEYLSGRIERAVTGRATPEEITGMNVQYRKLGLELYRESKVKDVKALQKQADRITRWARFKGVPLGVVREDPEVAATLVQFARGELTRNQAYLKLHKKIGIDRAEQLLRDAETNKGGIIDLAETSLQAKTAAVTQPAAVAFLRGFFTTGGIGISAEDIMQIPLSRVKELIRESMPRLSPQYRKIAQQLLKAETKEELFAIASMQAVPEKAGKTEVTGEGAKVMENLVIEAARGSKVIIKAANLEVES